MVYSVQRPDQRKDLTAWCGFALKISFRFIISLNCTFATDYPLFMAKERKPVRRILGQSGKK